MRTVDVLICIHGMMLEERPPLGRVQYRRLWDPILETHPVLGERLPDTHLVEVEWGKFGAHEARPDQWINFAQEFIAREVDPDEVRKRPGSHNLVYPTPREVPLPALPWKALLGPLRQVLMIRGFGDIIYYCSEDGQMAVQMTVYEQIFAAFERFRQGPPVVLRLHLVGHSIGAMLAYDLLQGLFGAAEPSFLTGSVLREQRAETAERFRFWRAQAHKHLEVGSLTTLGSPLPLMLLKSQRAVDTLATGNTLSCGELGLTEGPQPVWRNFYDVNDLLAFPVRPLFGDPNVIADAQVRPVDDPWSHAAYWANPDVHELVAELLMRRTVPAEVEALAW